MGAIPGIWPDWTLGAFLQHLCRVHSCEIILTLDQLFRKRCCLKDFDIVSGILAAFLFSGANHLCNFSCGHYGEQSCEIILHLDLWFRRCLLKKRFMDRCSWRTDEDQSQ